MKTFLLGSVAVLCLAQQASKPTPEELYIHYKADHEVQGNYLRAYDSALQEHRKYMKREKGITVEDYLVLMQEDKTFYRIHFVPRDSPGKPKLPLGIGIGGRLETLYAVDKKSYKVVQRAAGG